MKHRIAMASLIVVLAAAFTAGAVPRAQAQECSDATLHGGYGYTSTGTLLSNVPPPLVGPFAEVGRQSFDGHGNTQGTATLSANGNIIKVTFDGTYAVNLACTGNMTLHVSFPDGTQAAVDADLVIDNNTTEIRAIVTDPGFVESRVYRKQFPRQSPQR